MAGPRGKQPASETPEDAAEPGATPDPDAEFDAELALEDELTELEADFDPSAELAAGDPVGTLKILRARVDELMRSNVVIERQAAVPG